MSKKSGSLIERLKASGHKKVKVAVTDIDGVLRGKYMHIDKCISALEAKDNTPAGFGFCNVVFGWDCADLCYDNSTYSGWHTGYPDATVVLDESTYRTIPWEDNLPFLLGSFIGDDGKPLAVCPRSLLISAQDELVAMGFDVKAGFEFEWFNFVESAHSLEAKNYLDPKPLTPGMHGYSILRSAQNAPYFHALVDQLEAFNVSLEGLHTETGPGVYEAAIAASGALEAADKAVLFKAATKQIAHEFAIVPSFMARWHDTLPGCSGHIHQSLIKDGKPCFFDAKSPTGMSKLFESYLAGIIYCLPDVLPCFAPTINSYKRLVEGYWAPTRANWGIDNRTVAMRVISGSPKSMRLEARVGGADLNPYLALAACLKAGAYGVANKLELKDPAITGNGYESKNGQKLSGNLFEAASKMQTSKLARKLFGDAFIDHFSASRMWEWRQFNAAVTNWEMKRYFEII